VPDHGRGRRRAACRAGRNVRQIRRVGILPPLSLRDGIAVWHRVSLWGKRAERAASLLYKGAKVLVTGEESQHPYTDKNGNSRIATEFAARNFFLLAKPVKAQA